MITAKDIAIEQSEWEYSQGMYDHLIYLLDQSVYEQKQYDLLLSEINHYEDMQEERYDWLRFELSANQRDRITSGDYYNQDDIMKHLRKLK